ncbi:glycosyltransferase [Komagataeibacter medellinensis]|uniref:Glycosyltransferase n=1 Tax=Komagataeibacter medellinensis TaxID=1177712 RepID=A0ABQ6VUV3_9PROT|nr:glycosyltransferase [Komagataeibacter medellinensis]KAB8123966.1 glycosyltransferase [Komagataeibacter medellinensis]
MLTVTDYNDVISNPPTENIVTFDIFDTLLYRRYLNIEQVVSLVSAYALSVWGKAEQEDLACISNMRWATMTALKGNPDIGEEPALADVWTTLSLPRTSDLQAAKQAGRRIAEFEFSIERRNLAPVRGSQDVLKTLQKAGKRLVAISDMYFTQAQVRCFLQDAQLESFFENVFVSAHERLTKQTGNLFRHVWYALDVKPEQTCHIGDNPISDVERPIALGGNAIHILHNKNIGIEPVQYGRRYDIHLEIADLCKVFLFQIIFQAQRLGISKTYFLARDGILFREILEKWMPDILTDHFTVLDSEDLFLNRSGTSWLRFDFNGDWLTEVVGYVFFLAGGRITGTEIRSMLGLEDLPSPLNLDTEYVAATDSELIVNVLRSTGQEEVVKDTVNEKKKQVREYLNSIGFFDHENVQIVDIGYSGTVICNINRDFLLRDLADHGIRPPRLYFHCLASNAFFAHNATQAQPYGAFINELLLPFGALPTELSDSFAWLEYFFKHRALGSFEGYRKVGQAVEPVYTQRSDPEFIFPADRVLSAVELRDDDIVLLWMAATHHATALTDPLIARFAHPDMTTIAQMDAPVHETDARNTSERSIVLTAPGLSRWDLYNAAKKGDYWIPGSLLSSKMAAREEEAEKVHSSPDQDQSRTATKFWQKNLSRFFPRFDFDVSFYRKFYPDLGYFRNDSELAEHYRKSGQSVGRWGSQAEMLAAYEKNGWPVPEGFREGHYHDEGVASPADPSWLASHRFVEKHGNKNRSGNQQAETPAIHLPVPVAIEQSFAEEVACGQFPLTPAEQEQYKGGKLNATEIIFRRFNVMPGPWLNGFDLSGFRSLNSAWCGAVETPAQALLAFLRKGISQCAPLSINQVFDPAFYKATYLHDQDIPDETAYRDWLNRGAFLGEYPSEQARLAAGRNQPSLNRERSAVSKVFSAFLAECGKNLATEQFTTDQWANRARDQWQKGNGPAGETAMLNAVGQSPERADLWNELGNFYLEHKEDQKALDAFERVIATRHPNRWAFIHAMRLNASRGNYLRAFQQLCASARPWKEAKLWREERQHLFQSWFDHEYAQIAATPNAQRVFLNRLVDKMSTVGLPDALSLGRSDGPVLVLYGHDVAQRVLTHQWLDATGHASRRVQIFSRSQTDLLVENLPGASAVIFHDVALDASVMDAALYAGCYGIRRVFWAGGLAVGSVLDAKDALGLGLDNLQFSEPAANVPRTWRDLTLALLCDDVITTVPALIPSLHALGVRPSLFASAFVTALGETNLQEWKDPSRIFIRFSPSTSAGGMQRHMLPFLEGLLEKHPDLVLVVEGLAEDIMPEPSLVHRVERQDGVLGDSARMAILAASCLGIDVGYAGMDALWAAGATVATPVVTLGDLKDFDGPVSGIVSTPEQLAASVESLQIDPEKRAVLLENCCTALNRLKTSDKLETGPLREVSVGNRPRVLIVNLFAPPQTIGGASRVVEDNLDFFLKHDSGIDFAVLATDDLNESQGETRVDSWHGVPVFRIATPYEPNMYWRPYNAETEAYMHRVVRLLQPDLVHIHCPQRLTVAVSDVCRVMNIPYIVTLHDSWWISDYPFLIKEDGSPAGVNVLPASQSYSHQIGLPRSVERAIRLRDALHHASRLIGVSRSYSEMYRQLGFDVMTVENGISVPTGLKRIPGKGNVRLGHFGGMEWHKGAYILEEALREGNFRNLSLTIMDFTLEAGAEIKEMWGTTPVTIRSKVLPSEIGQLYRETDVVVAASTWPESYGLVAREGAAHGCWVIANAQGAMGEDIEPGVNGFIVDTSTSVGLAAVLQTINDNASDYTRPPAIRARLRTSNEQGQDMLNIYRDFLGPVWN